MPEEIGQSPESEPKERKLIAFGFSVLNNKDDSDYYPESFKKTLVSKGRLHPRNMLPPLDIALEPLPPTVSLPVITEVDVQGKDGVEGTLEDVTSSKSLYGYFGTDGEILINVPQDYAIVAKLSENVGFITDQMYSCSGFMTKFTDPSGEVFHGMAHFAEENPTNKLREYLEECQKKGFTLKEIASVVPSDGDVLGENIIATCANINPDAKVLLPLIINHSEDEVAVIVTQSENVVALDHPQSIDYIQNRYFDEETPEYQEATEEDALAHHTHLLRQVYSNFEELQRWEWRK